MFSVRKTKEYLEGMQVHFSEIMSTKEVLKSYITPLLFMIYWWIYFENPMIAIINCLLVTFVIEFVRILVVFALLYHHIDHYDDFWIPLPVSLTIEFLLYWWFGFGVYIRTYYILSLYTTLMMYMYYKPARIVSIKKEKWSCVDLLMIIGEILVMKTRIMIYWIDTILNSE